MHLLAPLVVKRGANVPWSSPDALFSEHEEMYEPQLPNEAPRGARTAKMRSTQAKLSQPNSRDSVRARGFTLIELMITIAVLVITLTLAVPSFRNIIQNNRSTALANELSSAINLGRSEAIKRGQEVRVCPRNPLGTGCTGNDWTVGWLVRETGAGGAVLRVWDAPRAGAIITYDPDTINAVIRFDGLGGLANQPRTIALRFDGCTGEQARQIDVGAAGRISVRRVACP